MKAKYAVPILVTAAFLLTPKSSFALRSPLTGRDTLKIEARVIEEFSKNTGYSKEYVASCLQPLAVLFKSKETSKNEELSGPPVPKAEVREEDAAPLASNTNAIDELNDQINKYSDLTASERAKLGEKVLENGDAGLVSRYNSAKKIYGAPAPAEEIAVPVDTGETPTATKTPEAQPSAASVPEKAVGVDIGALYDQVNGYSRLDADERAELDAKVMESGNASLIGYYTKVKKNAAPVEIVKPEAATEPARTDSAVEEISQLSNEAENVESEKTKPVETLVPVEVKIEPSVKPVEKVAETAPKYLSTLKDSLQDAISACQDRINLMSEGTFAADSAAIAEAIGEIGAIMSRGLPVGDVWAEYKLRHLKEYFSGACERFSGRSEQ